jgi:hypothetical protein
VPYDDKEIPAAMAEDGHAVERVSVHRQKSAHAPALITLSGPSRQLSLLSPRAVSFLSDPWLSELARSHLANFVKLANAWSEKLSRQYSIKSFECEYPRQFRPARRRALHRTARRRGLCHWLAFLDPV